jgi:hypothetical protein
MSVMPVSRTAHSPASRISRSTSSFDFSWISSMRTGWMRPSPMSFSRVSRAISRRIGSKHDRTTASGVSSIIRLVPVAASKALMLRPSRPMMRPFMSSFGSVTVVTVDSDVSSEATRCMPIAMILRARLSPSSRACASMSRTIDIASRFASSSICSMSACLASLAVMPATRSSSCRARSPIRLISSRARAISLSFVSIACSRRSSEIALESRVDSRWEIRSSFLSISSRRRLRSASASLRMRKISSFASTNASRFADSADRSASCRRVFARASAELTCFSAIDCRTKYPTPAPARRPRTRPTTISIARSFPLPVARQCAGPQPGTSERRCLCGYRYRGRARKLQV